MVEFTGEDCLALEAMVALGFNSPHTQKAIEEQGFLRNSLPLLESLQERGLIARQGDYWHFDSLKFPEDNHLRVIKAIMLMNMNGEVVTPYGLSLKTELGIGEVFCALGEMTGGELLEVEGDNYIVTKKGRKNVGLNGFLRNSELRREIVFLLSWRKRDRYDLGRILDKDQAAILSALEALNAGDMLDRNMSGLWSLSETGEHVFQLMLEAKLEN